MTLDEVLQAVAERVPYLRASTTIDDDDKDHWVRGDALVQHPSMLARVVRASIAGFETDDEAVAASLFAESYAFRVAGVVLAAYAIDVPVPSSAPAATAVTVDQPRPAAVAYLDPHTRRRTATECAHELIGDHLASLVAALHAEFTVGERLLWGNVAAACAVAFRAVEATSPTTHDRTLVRDRAQAFVDACRPWFEGVGRFVIVEHEGRGGWYWDRTSCCLWFRTENGHLCDNCSLIDASALREQRTREVAAPPQ